MNHLVQTRPSHHVPGAGPWQPWRRRVLHSPATVALLVGCGSAFLMMLGLCVAETGAGAWTTLRASVLGVSGCPRALQWEGALVLARLWLDDEWWRIVTAAFVHGSWLHLGLNAWSLWAVGEWAEFGLGSLRCLATFVLSSVAGCLASAAWSEAPVVVGASAGVLGLAAAILTVRIWGRGPRRKRLAPVSPRVLGGFLVLLVAAGFFVPVIAQAGHLGGLLVGFALGVSFAADGRRGWRLAGAGLGVILLVGLAGLARAPTWRVRYHEFVGYRLLELGRAAQAVAAFDRVLLRRPEDAGLANAVAYALAEAGTDLDRADHLVDRALLSDPGNADYLDTLGWIQCRQGKTAAGARTLRTAQSAATGPIPEIEAHLAECAHAIAE